MQIILNVIISIADVAALIFLLLVVDFYISDGTSSRFGFLPGWMLDKGSIILIAVFFVFFSIKNLAGIIISNAQFRFIGKVAVRISQQKLERYLGGDFHNFINIDSAEHIRKIAFQPFEFSQHIVGGIQHIFIQFFLVLLTVVSILIYNPKLFIILFLILLPPVTFVFFFIKRKVSAIKKNIHASNENSFRFLLDALTGYTEANIYQRQEFFSNRFAMARQAFSKYLFNSLAVQAMPSRIIETFAVLGLFMLIVIVKWSGVNDSSTLITIGAFMAGAYKIIPGIVKMINALSLMKTYESSIRDIEDITQVPSPGNDEVAGQTVQSVRLQDLHFSYGDRKILNGLSFCINKKDFIGINGKSGRGKTTLLNILLGFLPLDSGKIFANEREVSSGELKNFWPSIAYVRQQPFLIHDTIVKNICLEENNHDEARLKEVLKISGLKELVESSPEGIHQVISESGKNISGGQQQRIAIARALYKDAALIFLDEPFNELDEPSVLKLVQHFRDISASGKIVIMITHDSKCLSYCNKIISLDAN